MGASRARRTETVCCSAAAPTEEGCAAATRTSRAMAELTKPSVASATTAPSISFGNLTPEDSALLLRLAERQKQLVEVTARARALGGLDGAAAPARGRACSCCSCGGRGGAGNCRRAEEDVVGRRRRLADRTFFAGVASDARASGGAGGRRGRRPARRLPQVVGRADARGDEPRARGGAEPRAVGPAQSGQHVLRQRDAAGAARVPAARRAARRACRRLPSSVRCGRDGGLARALLRGEPPPAARAGAPAAAAPAWGVPRGRGGKPALQPIDHFARMLSTFGRAWAAAGRRRRRRRASRARRRRRSARRRTPRNGSASS